MAGDEAVAGSGGGVSSAGSLCRLAPVAVRCPRASPLFGLMRCGLKTVKTCIVRLTPPKRNMKTLGTWTAGLVCVASCTPRLHPIVDLLVSHVLAVSLRLRMVYPARLHRLAGFVLRTGWRYPCTPEHLYALYHLVPYHYVQNGLFILSRLPFPAVLPCSGQTANVAPITFVHRACCTLCGVHLFHLVHLFSSLCICFLWILCSPVCAFCLSPAFYLLAGRNK